MVMVLSRALTFVEISAMWATTAAKSRFTGVAETPIAAREKKRQRRAAIWTILKASAMRTVGVVEEAVFLCWFLDDIVAFIPFPASPGQVITEL